MKRLLQRLLPRAWYHALTSPYHFVLTFVSALLSGFPAQKLVVIGVTGTKGKSSVADMLYTTLKDARVRVAVASTIRFAIQEKSEPNLFKMTLPGRGFIQRFLKKAVDAGCTHAIVEVTSESTRNYRHLFLDLDALVFTNLQKEHIESHGSFEKYAEAKRKIGRALVQSSKRPRAIIGNKDDAEGKKYLALPVETKLPFSSTDATQVSLGPGTASFTYGGTRFSLKLPGSFTIMNALAVIKAARFAGVSLANIATSLSKLERIPGRTERIDAGQDFTVVVDYAHTPDSLRALYDAYPVRKICVLGNTGGGRDTWKRPAMGAIADTACAHVILTDEDPYDENPVSILEDMKSGMTREPKVVLNRREAIRQAFILAQEGDAVLITGKGTDPYIMRANGSKEPWSDAEVAREELEKLFAK